MKHNTTGSSRNRTNSLAKAATMVLTVILGITFASGIRADDKTEQARERFNVAVAHYSAEEYEKALHAFREANRLNPNWKVLYNIGQSAAASKEYGIAYEAFEAYLAKGGDDIAKERHQEVLDEMDRLFKMVGSLEVLAPPGSDVIVNGQHRGKTPLDGKIKVSAGVSLQIQIVTDEVTVLDETHKVSRGETIRINSDQQNTGSAQTGQSPLDETKTDPIAEPGDSTKTLKIIGWGTMGVGAGALIGCAVTGGMTLSLNSELKKDCNGIHCDEDRKSDITKMNTLSTTSTVLAAVGGTVAAAGIVILVVAKMKSKKSETPNTVSLFPILDGKMSGLAVQGRF